ncbi:hypothetical protein Gotur_021013, partial [Gossypium turneri]
MKLFFLTLNILFQMQWMFCALWEMKFQKKDELYYFAIKMFQIPVKREVFLNLDPDDRVWWLRREYAEQNPIASFLSFVATSS